MEKHETFCAKGRRKKVQIGVAGGGGVCNIGGIVLWGGALAAASFAAAFAVRRGRRRDANEKNFPLRKEEQASGQGLRSSPSFGCDDPRCSSNELKTQMIDTPVEVDSCQPKSTESLILEENVLPATHCRNESFDTGNQEILPASYSEVDSNKLCNDYAGIEEFSFPVIVQEDRIKDDLKEALMETYEVLREEEAVDAVGTNIEEPSLVNLVEQVENDSEDEDREGHTIKFTESLILEDNVLPTTHCGKESYHTGNLEILPADDAEGYDIKLCDAGMTVEGFSVPSVEQENRVENDLVVKEEIMEVKSNVFPLIETIKAIEEEEAVDAVNIGKPPLEHLVEVENDGDDDDIVNVVEGIRDDETEETKDASKICIGKISSMIVKEEDDKKEIVKEAPLMGRDEAWNDEKAINDDLDKTTDINSSVHPIEEEETEFQGPMEQINLRKEEEEIVVISKVTTKLTSLTHSVEDEVDKYSGKQSLLSERTEFWTGEKTSDMNVNLASSLLATKETEDEDDEDEPIVEKGEEDSEETGSTSAGSRAEEIWPEESIEALSLELAKKVREEDQDRTTKTGEHNSFNDSKTNNFEKQGHGYQTTQTPILLKKVKTLVIDLPTILTKWKISIRFILVLALTMLFLFTHQHALYYMFA